jgi:hypothetical protein
MNAIHQKETKSRKVIGVMRTYDHAALLRWLGSIGVSLDQWIHGFTKATREDLLRTAPAGIVAQELAFENITPTVGFEVITKFLSGNGVSPEELEVMVHAFGDDGTTPVDGDTTLGNETVRKNLSSKSYSGASAFYTVFYDLSEGNGTHAEMGLFANADDATPDDGTLWDRSLISITKINTQSLTIDYEDSFVNNL